MSRKFHLTPVLAFAMAISLLTRPARADGVTSQLSEYEQDSVKEALKRVGGKVDTKPEGKLVESVEIVTLEVIEERDPAPNLLNLLHATTRETVIRREVLLGAGSVYRQALVDETARNLRTLPQLSVVLLVPLRGSDGNRVKLLVVTKDVWSLRIGWDFAFYNGKFTSLFLQPSETNVLGTTQVIVANVQLTAHSYSFGAGYLVPRIDGSHLSAQLLGSLSLNCANGALEGGSGTFRYGQPLYSSDADWSWGTAVTFNNSLVRPLADAKSAICSNPAEQKTPVTVSRQTITEPDGATEATLAREVLVPNRYRLETVRGQLALTRSLNTIDKVNLSFGAEIDRRVYSTIPTRDGELSARDATYKGAGSERQRDPESIDPIPVSPSDRSQALALWESRFTDLRDTRIGPYVQLHSFSNRYLKAINFATLGLQEDLALGHDVYLRVYPATRPISSRNLIGLFASASYTIPLQSGFFRALAAGTFERADSVAQSRSKVTLWAQLASPITPAGRFVSNLTVVRRSLRYRDVDLGLGGSGQLRGYRPNAFVGSDVFVLNSEFRTRPIQLFSILAGLNLFYDVGDATDSLHHLELRHGAGVGLRVLLPQLDRDAFRVDFGFPLGPNRDGRGELTVTAGFKQVFDAPVARPDVLITQ